MNTRTVTSIKSNKKLYKAFAVMIMVVILITSTAIIAFADGSADDNSVTDALTNLSDFIIAVIKIVGFIIAIYGIVQLALSLIQHDGSQRIQHLMFVGVGAIIFFAKEILEIMGISLN